MKCLLFICMLSMPILAVTATSLEETELVCAVCGTKSTQTIILSTNQFGSPDLDLRPPEMMRSTMPYWVQQCPSCGYCYSSVEELASEAQVTIRTPQYLNMLQDQDLNLLARRFFCLMQILDGAGEKKAAIHAAICASWACDDSGNAELAIRTRRLIGERLNALRLDGEKYIEQLAGDELLASDIARRAGDFGKARLYAQNGIALEPEETIAKILEYELELIETSDTAAHTVADALGE